jgi:hypothetical protein
VKSGVHKVVLGGANAQTEEVELDGTGVASSTKRTGTVTNNFADKAVTLFWKAEDGKDVKIDDIPAGGKVKKFTVMMGFSLLVISYYLNFPVDSTVNNLLHTRWLDIVILSIQYFRHYYFTRSTNYRSRSMRSWVIGFTPK